jgi:hypothetical protein
VSGTGDVELDAIRRTLASFESAFGLQSVVALLREYATRRVRIDVLDMIGHSRSPGFLVIGSWVVDDSPQTGASFSEFFRPCLEQLGVRAIRLLGCGTALTDRGNDAIRRIARATRCEVFGTKRYISKHDYGPQGFMRDDTLARQIVRAGDAPSMSLDGTPKAEI